jgi:hypothetical protein
MNALVKSFRAYIQIPQGLLSAEVSASSSEIGNLNFYISNP